VRVSKASYLKEKCGTFGGYRVSFFKRKTESFRCFGLRKYGYILGIQGVNLKRRILGFYFLSYGQWSEKNIIVETVI
jgi:hypothetical protein